MSIRLGSGREPGFSKPARFLRHALPLANADPWSHRPHLDAVGRDHRTVPRAIRRRALADDLPERPTERAEAHEAHVEADVGDAPVGLAEEEHRSLNAPTLQVTMRRLTEGGPEAPAEVGLGAMGDL